MKFIDNLVKKSAQKFFKAQEQEIVKSIINRVQADVQIEHMIRQTMLKFVEDADQIYHGGWNHDIGDENRILVRDRENMNRMKDLFKRLARDMVYTALDKQVLDEKLIQKLVKRINDSQVRPGKN